MAIEQDDSALAQNQLEWYRGVSLVSSYRDGAFLLAEFRVQPPPLHIKDTPKQEG